MASFFQPGSNDPAIEDCEPSRFQIYCNSLLSTDPSQQPWHRLLNLGVGSAAILCFLIYITIRVFISFRRSKSSKQDRSRNRSSYLHNDGTGSPPSLAIFKTATSFRLNHTSSAPSEDAGVRDLEVAGLERIDDGGSIASSSREEKINFAVVHLDSLSPDPQRTSSRDEALKKLMDIHTTTGQSGIAIRFNKLEEHVVIHWNALLDRAHARSLPILMIADHDCDVWQQVEFGSLVGVIIENACILPNGKRRDYFRATRLRETMARCSRERETRPDFFVGFQDLWHQRPHPSVVRRAVKLAEHFGAVVEHGPASKAAPMFGLEVKAASQTLSGFDYLRRNPVIELQKYWISEARKVWVQEEHNSAVSQLSIQGLTSVFPDLSRLLEHKALPRDFEGIVSEESLLTEWPEYVDQAPLRKSFWDYSSQNQPLSSKGCFPITAEPSASHYEAVLETQKHLKDLQMLQPLTGAETQRLVTTFRQLTAQYSGNRLDLIQSLIDGLEVRSVLVYKGLDTGFGVADNVSYFWGVSSNRNDTELPCVDIFISLKNPHDATTLLHTWLSHHGVPRAERYDLEYEHLVANSSDGNAITIPQSLAAAVDRASHAEILSVLQQLRVSGLSSQFKDPIIKACEKSLILESSKYSWHHQVAYDTLAGSRDIRECLKIRLEYFARSGMTALPDLENLVTLHALMSSIMEHSLFFGDREPLNTIITTLLESWDPEAGTQHEYVDINVDLFTLIFFNVLRKAAFEDVYIEATDRCPFFLSQPDQAAVFSELWVLGSQCEIYFGILPRTLGAIVYERYKAFLREMPPELMTRKGTEIMSMYADVEPEAKPDKTSTTLGKRTHSVTNMHQNVAELRKHLTELGAMSIFCLPAIVDVLLLSFVGRGVFMTAFMDSKHLQAAGLALLISLLLTAGVTGWVGSIGNYYLVNYAYDNMIHFHVQRLSGGFILTLLIAVCGFVGFSIQESVPVGLIFAAYMIVIATYFNLLGIMATMHQRKSPFTSGRIVLWRTIPLLLISPLLSSLVNGHDLEIYLPVMYAFLFLTLFQYRRLCHEWSGWLQNIPKISEKDVLEWYKKKEKPETGDDEDSKQNQDRDAQESLRHTVYLAQQGEMPSNEKNGLVAKIAQAMPYVDWLFVKTCPNGKIPDAFSTSWFTQLGESLKQQKQISRGLKEHNILMLFRFARYDIGQNLGLFLVALMDRWVGIVMGARLPHSTIYLDSRSRYGICFCILYFCASVMLLDATLQGYWETTFKLSEEKLSNHTHAAEVAKQWERRRIRTFFEAFGKLLSRIMPVFGVCTILLWLFVETPETIILYYCYILGYTCVIIFQFNRCFTTNVRTHIAIILSSAVVGFIVGLALRAIPATADWLYAEILAQNIAAVLAALGTFLWTLKDWSSPSVPSVSELDTADAPKILAQPRLFANNATNVRVKVSQAQRVKGTSIVDGDGSFVAAEALKLLQESLRSPNKYAKQAPWSSKVIETAIKMWTNHELSVMVVSRQQFQREGLENVSSFSHIKSTTLEIVAAFLGETELHRPSWQPLLAKLVTESILYHITRFELNMSHAKGVRAEHLLHLTKTISRRTDFELALEDLTSLDRISRRTNVELMKHLCLGISVDSRWDSLPEAVRRVVIDRVTGTPIHISPEFLRWTDSNNVDTTDSDFHASLCLHIFQKVQEKGQAGFASQLANKLQPLKLVTAALKPVRINQSRPTRSLLQHWLRIPFKIPITFAKWVAIISGAGSDIERELWYCLKNTPLTGFLVGILLFFWKLCWHAKNLWLYVILLHNRPALVNITRLSQKGARRKIKGNRILVELPRKTVTGFAACDGGDFMVLNVFDGAHHEQPADTNPLYKAVYDEKLRLQARVDNATLATTYNYSDSGSKWPISKEVNDREFRTIGFYDKYGRIHRGTITIGDKEFAFQYHYKATPKGNSDVLGADFKQVNPLSEDMLSVFWGAPLEESLADYDWVSSEKLCRLVKLVGGRKYITEVEYKHRRDPLITTFLDEGNGRRTAIAKAPKVFSDEALFLARPNNLSFDTDDLLVYHSKVHVRLMRKYALGRTPILQWINPMLWLSWRGRRVYQTIPTWQLRTELWSQWLKTESIDAPMACWLDELILREEPLLRQYWRCRDRGNLIAATQALDSRINQIVSAIDIQTDISEVCLLPIKSSDLYAMGLGKDATEVTTRPDDCFRDTQDRVSVIFNDIGCWPEAPGGVSNCRRDLVNGHSTIRNHVLAECANDYGIPRFQVEKSVQSLKLLPLWGLDRKTAHHGLIDNLLQSQVDAKVRDTDVQRDIVGIFIPLIKDFVRGARTRKYTRADLIKYSNVMLSMSKYYEHKDYSRTWESKEVERAWVDAWLVPYHDPNIVDPSTCFDLEKPSMSDFRDALGIYLAYFFIFSVKIPDRCPRVFQSTHHGISSLFGMILRYRRGTTFGIWDHAILWRECCLNISPAQCELPISVQSMLLSGIGLATRLAYFHADVIMPCTSLFNPMWEAEIGTDRGQLGSKRIFNRRIDPIVNGISNMESFTPVDKVRTDTPTVVMLSNVQFIKGIKTAILAADIIINRYGFKDYKLVVYGAKDRQPSYALEMAKLIVENNLSNRVILAGFGKPKEVLKDAWLFMNSSISEGLPLAIGEAALAGVPIVATEVGATALVMTDPEDQEKRYGEVVPPNDPLALARAQLNILGMVGPWAKFTEEVKVNPAAAVAATLPDEITPDDVQWLTKRMYEKTEDRRQLGLLSREVVLHSFHGNRYLREHEQMYWIQWHLAQMRDDVILCTEAAQTHRFGVPEPLRYIDEDEENHGVRTAYESQETDSDALSQENKGTVSRWQDSSHGMEIEKREPNRLSKGRPLTLISPV